MGIGQRLLQWKAISRSEATGKRLFAAVSSSERSTPHLHTYHRIHLLFGANTDVGKSVISSGLVRAAALADCDSKKLSVNYIKPLQCGGSDETFVLHNNDKNEARRMNHIKCHTLFSWETPASPHLVSRLEKSPVSDDEVLTKLSALIFDIDSAESNDIDNNLEHATITTIIETAGGVLSPSSSSPLNKTTTADHWGWSTQADMYTPLKLPVVFVGDGKLGGISVTLSSLEALWNRGYRVDAVVFIEGENYDSDDDTCIRFGRGNAEALSEYLSMRSKLEPNNDTYNNLLHNDDAIMCFPPLPPMPIPLNEWYDETQKNFFDLNRLLEKNSKVK